MRSTAAALVVLMCGALAVGCYKPPPEPLTLKSGMLTVDNRSKQEWSNVEVWLNTHYRIAVKSIPAGGRYEAPLNYFVAGYGQRFNYSRMQIRDLRMTARLPDGSPFEVKKEFEKDGLAALGEIGKKK